MKEEELNFNRIHKTNYRLIVCKYIIVVPVGINDNVLSGNKKADLLSDLLLLVRSNGTDLGYALEKLFIRVVECFNWDSEFAQSLLSILKMALFTISKETELVKEVVDTIQSTANSISSPDNIESTTQLDGDNRKKKGFVAGVQKLSNMLVSNALRPSLWEDSKMVASAMEDTMANVSKLQRLHDVKHGLSSLTKGGVVSFIFKKKI